MVVEKVEVKKHEFKVGELKTIHDFAREKFIPVALDDTIDFLIEKLLEYKPKKILEIGTAIGYSGSIILKTLPQANLVTIEKNIQNYELAKKNFEKTGVSSRVNQILGDALENVRQFDKAQEKFDFIFVDGPKSQYVLYLPYFEKILQKGGVIFADDVLYMHLVNGPEYVIHKHRTIVNNLRKFLLEANTNCWQTVVYDIGEGVSLTTKKENVWI